MSDGLFYLVGDFSYSFNDMNSFFSTAGTAANWICYKKLNDIQRLAERKIILVWVVANFKLEILPLPPASP